MKTIAFLVYGSKDSDRNALGEEKYRDLATAFVERGYEVRSVLYSDPQAAELSETLTAFAMILVWVNPLEQGNDRSKLDALLAAVAAKGCRVSAHPEVILKMGTKDILYTTRDMEWGGDTEMYTDFEQFTRYFPVKLETAKTRVLKRYRGNGGNGVYKIQLLDAERVCITHAMEARDKRTVSWGVFFETFRPFFLEKGLLIDQPWNTQMVNGMLRCYVCGTRVAGFGYQEVNALYEVSEGGESHSPPPSKRYYFTERCGLFSDLKEVMELKWIPELQRRFAITDERMPVIWDADFFINSSNSTSAAGKYTLCEINVSCVSPFPPSAIRMMVEAVEKRTGS